jgi:CBS domain-containing protein
VLEELTRDLSAWPLWNTLPQAIVRAAAGSFRIEYLPAGTPLDPGRATVDALVSIRTGHLDFLGPDGTLRDRMMPGDTRLLASAFERSGAVRTGADTLAWFLPRPAFDALQGDAAFARAFDSQGLAARLSSPRTLRAAPTVLDLTRRRAGDVARQPTLVLPPDTPISTAARAMRREDCSCVLVTSEPPSLVTDRELRNEVVAGGLPPEAPLSALHVPAVVLDAQASLLDALLGMMGRGVRQVLVPRRDGGLGVLTDADLSRGPPQGSLLLAGGGHPSRDEPALFGDRVARVVASLLDEGYDASVVGQVAAAAHDARVASLIAHARAELGAPPLRFAWVAVDAIGRCDPVVLPVPDHVLAYEEGARPEATAWFQAFARLVGDRLDADGLPNGPGRTRATNPLWCRPTTSWRRYVADWTAERGPDAPTATVGPFLDARVVAGDADMAAPLILGLRQAAVRPPFLRRLARAALTVQPPVTCLAAGFLRADGQTVATLDAAAALAAPIADLARIAALSCGSDARSTAERLRSFDRSGLVDTALAQDLAAAFDWVSRQILRASLARPGCPQHLHAIDMDPSDRAHYREAAAVVQEARATLTRLTAYAPTRRNP